MRVTAPQPDSQDRRAWAALYWAGCIGPAGFLRLLSRFGSAQAVIEAPPKELAAPTLKLDEGQIAAIREQVPARLEAIEGELADLQADGIAVICAFEERYPQRLREAENPPPVICVSGELTDGDRLALAIVGTREPTPEGRKVAREVARACAARGITIVSGLARGTDTMAHRGALDADGRTVAVLGSGIRHIHPKRNIRLAARIAKQGAVISEVAPGDNPTGARLMARNRLTSALARGVLAIESTSRGGTLKTARDAWKQGRLVFACDWQADKRQAEGTRALIAEGAEPILGPDAADLIEHLLRTYTPPAPDQPAML
ncbi:MAG: DNA-processing protein DprA [Armatimonadota bacterium]|nr:DNA-processing protein DprA [Armatimonadota bacterium]